MSGFGTRIVLRGQKPLALCDRCPCFGSLFPPLAALTFAASSIICAFGLAFAAPRSPYRHLELCGIALSKGDALGNIIGNGIFLYAKGISKLTVQPFLRLAEIAFISGSIMLFVLYTDFVAVMQTFYHLGNLAAVTGLHIMEGAIK